MSQKQLAGEIGISPSRVNDYISGRSEPTLKIARLLCRVLNIPRPQCWDSNPKYKYEKEKENSITN